MKYQEFIPDELNVFANQPVLQCINDAHHIEYSALNTLDNATTIEFDSLPYDDKYKDLSWTYLKLRLQLVKADGTKYTNDDVFQPHLISNTLHSIFKSAFISLNGQSMRSVEQNYHYKEYIETSLNYTIESATSRLNSQLYVPNSVEVSLGVRSKNSKIFELYGRLNLININRLLIPRVKVNLRLHLENPEFFIKEDTEQTKSTSKLKIHGANLYIRHVTPTLEILNSHEKLLLGGESAVYEFKRGEIITQNVAAGTKNLTIPNLYSGPRPSLIVFGMVSNKAHVGERKLNPFEFKPFNLRSFNFIVNGSARPTNPYDIQMDDSHSCYTHLLSKLYESIGYHNIDRSNLVTYENFTKDHFFIVEDLSNFDVGLPDISEVPRTVSIGVNGTFTKNLEETITCVLYYLIPSRIEISKDRSVTLVQ